MIPQQSAQDPDQLIKDLLNDPQKRSKIISNLQSGIDPLEGLDLDLGTAPMGAGTTPTPSTLDSPTEIAQPPKENWFFDKPVIDLRPGATRFADKLTNPNILARMPNAQMASIYGGMVGGLVEGGANLASFSPFDLLMLGTGLYGFKKTRDAIKGARRLYDAFNAMRQSGSTVDKLAEARRIGKAIESAERGRKIASGVQSAAGAGLAVHGGKVAFDPSKSTTERAFGGARGAIGGLMTAVGARNFRATSPAVETVSNYIRSEMAKPASAAGTAPPGATPPAPVLSPSPQLPPSPPVAGAGTSPFELQLRFSSLADGQVLQHPGGTAVIRHQVDPKTSFRTTYLELPNGTQTPLLKNGKPIPGNFKPFMQAFGTTITPVEGQIVPRPQATAPVAGAPPASGLPPPPPTTPVRGVSGRAAKTPTGRTANQAVKQQDIEARLTDLRTQMAKAKSPEEFIASKAGKFKQNSPNAHALERLQQELMASKGVTTSTTPGGGTFKIGDKVSFKSQGGKDVNGTITEVLPSGSYRVGMTAGTKQSTTTKKPGDLVAGHAGPVKVGSKPVIDTTATQAPAPTVTSTFNIDPVVPQAQAQAVPEQKLLPPPAPTTTPVEAAKLIKEAAKKQGVDPKTIFGHIGKSGGAHPQPPPPAPGTPRKRAGIFGRLANDQRGILNLSGKEFGLTQAEVDALPAPRPVNRPEPVSWNDAVRAVHQAQKHGVTRLKEFKDAYKEFVDTATYQAHESVLTSAWRTMERQRGGDAPMRFKDALDQKQIREEVSARRAARGETADFDPTKSKMVVEPPTEAADFATGKSTGEAKVKKVAPPDQIMADVRERVKRGHYLDYRKYRNMGLPHETALQSALQDAYDAEASRSYDRISIKGFRRMFGKPGAAAAYTKPAEGKRVMYEETPFDEGDVEGSTREALVAAGMKMDAPGLRGKRIVGSDAGKSQSQTFAGNVGEEGGLIHYQRGGARTYYLPRAQRALTADEQKQEAFLDKMWEQVVAHGDDAGKGVPHYPVARVRPGAELGGTPATEAAAKVPARAPERTFRRRRIPSQLEAGGVPRGTVPMWAELSPPFSAKPLVKFPRPDVERFKQITGKEGIRPRRGTATATTGTKTTFPRLPGRDPEVPPYNYEAVTLRTPKGERIYDEISRNETRPKPPVNVLSRAWARELPKAAPWERPFHPAKTPPPGTVPATPHTVSSGIHPIGGAGYRSAENSSGKNLTVRPEPGAFRARTTPPPRKVRTPAGISGVQRAAIDQKILNNDTRSLRLGRDPSGARRYVRGGTQLQETGDFAGPGALRQIQEEVLSRDLTDAEMTLAAKYYNEFVGKRPELLASIARDIKESVPRRYAAGTALIEGQKIKQERRLQVKAREQVRSKRDAQLKQAESEVAGYLSRGQEFLTPQQMKTIGKKFRLEPEDLSNLINKVRSDRSLPAPPTSRPPLLSRLRDDTGAIGSGTHERIQARFDARKTNAQKAGVPFDDQLEMNRAAAQEKKANTLLTPGDKVMETTLDTHIGLHRAAKIAGKEFLEGSSPIEWSHAVVGSGAGKFQAAVYRISEVQKPHWKIIPKSEWAAADTAIDYALAYNQILHGEKILVDHVRVAEQALARAQQVGLAKAIKSARNLLAIERRQLRKYQMFGVGVKGSKITASEAATRLAQLRQTIPQAHLNLVDDVLGEVAKSFTKSLQLWEQHGLVSPGAATRWQARGGGIPYVGGIQRLGHSARMTTSAVISKMQSRGQLTVDDANALRRLTGAGDRPAILGWDSVYRTLAMDFRDAERAKFVNKLPDWFSHDPEIMRKAPSNSAPTPDDFIDVYTWNGGKMQRWFLHQDLSAPILGATELEAQLAGITATKLSKLNSFFARAGTSLSPPWQAYRNPVRDGMTAAVSVYSPEGRPAFPIARFTGLKTFGYEWWKNLHHVATHQPDYLKMLEHYGALTGYTGANAPEAVLEGVITRNRGTGIYGPATRASRARSAAIRIAHVLENTPKLMSFNRLTKMGVDPDTAGIITGNWGGTANLSVHGSVQPVTTALFLYANPNAQEKRRWITNFWRAATESGSTARKRALGRGANSALRRFAYVLMGTTAAYAANAKWNMQFKDENGEPEIGHVPPDILASNWVWMTPEKTKKINGDVRNIYIRYPKETPQQILLPIIQRALALVAVGEAEGAKRFVEEEIEALLPGRFKADFDAPAKSIARGVWSNVTPPARGGVNLVADTELESGRKITSRRVEGNSPEYQYTPYTDSSVKRYSKGLNKIGIDISPKQLEYLVKTLGMGVGSVALDFNEAIEERLVGSFKSPASTDRYQRARRLPGLGVLVTAATGPGEIDGKELIDTDRFYKAALEAATAIKDFNTYQKGLARDPDFTESALLKSKQGKFWVEEGFGYVMDDLVKIKGELITQSGVLLEIYKSPKTTDAEREDILKDMMDLHKSELEILKIFKEEVLGERPKLPPPPPPLKSQPK